ncbi:MAG: toll/interleukin-1 receptor domain-containing protein [Alphaproteobacteria bacterium]|nr:toll/interleukin-1 receptor domain-containing protein [Alphaproteobacteria bacterium]
MLEEHGGRVYVDKKDDALPPYTSRETAEILRDRIVKCKKFLMLATNNSKESRWVPWELGISDGYKKPLNVAIFPGVDKAVDTKWTEQEYLGIYDRIVWGNLADYPRPLWMVYNHYRNTAIPLRDWLTKD